MPLCIAMHAVLSYHANDICSLKCCTCWNSQIWFVTIIIVYKLFICVLHHNVSHYFSLQCFDTVGWASGRASGLTGIEWWGAVMVVCPKNMVQLMPLPPRHLLQSRLVFNLSGAGFTQVVLEKRPLNGCVPVSHYSFFLWHWFLLHTVQGVYLFLVITYICM